MDRTEKEIESLDPESRQVAELLGGLKRVEAPSNFEFGVRARIANGAPRNQTASLFPFFKVAAPLALLLAIGSGVLFYGDLLRGDESIAKVDPPEQEVRESTSSPEDLVATVGPRDSASGPHEEEQQPVEPKLNPSSRQAPGTEVRDRNSVNRSSRVAPSVRQPAGGGAVDSTLLPSTVISAPGTSGTIGLKEAFEMLGMPGKLTANGWTVRSAKDGSHAQRSGVQAGDVVESVDGLAISNKSSFASPLTIKSIRVLRDGKVVDLKLAN